MYLLNYISQAVIPLTIFCIVGYSILNKNAVYDDFVFGAKDGVMTVFKILPTMVGLMIGVGAVSSSGLLSFLTDQFAKCAGILHIPAAVIPAFIIKMFSSSAATGLVLDIFKNYGPDSYEGLILSIAMSCTETIFYTMSVYFMTVKVTKTRWTLTGALFATFAGIVASVVMAGWM